MIKANMQEDHRTFECTHIDITWLTTMGRGGEVENQPWLLGTLIYNTVKIERWRSFI